MHKQPFIINTHSSKEIFVYFIGHFCCSHVICFESLQYLNSLYQFNLNLLLSAKDYIEPYMQAVIQGEFCVGNLQNSCFVWCNLRHL